MPQVFEQSLFLFLLELEFGRSTTLFLDAICANATGVLWIACVFGTNFMKKFVSCISQGLQAMKNGYKLFGCFVIIFRKVRDVYFIELNPKAIKAQRIHTYTSNLHYILHLSRPSSGGGARRRREAGQFSDCVYFSD